MMLDMLRESDPKTTVGEFVATLGGMVAHDECLYCHKPISRFRVSDDRPWVHDDPSRMRGCRAASFDCDGRDGWNDALPKEWKATPKPE